MATPVRGNDKLAIYLISADDRAEVLVNGTRTYSANLGDGPQQWDLLVHFQQGRNLVRVKGIDHQPNHRSINYEVLLNGKKIGGDSKTQESN